MDSRTLCCVSRIKQCRTGFHSLNGVRPDEVAYEYTATDDDWGNGFSLYGSIRYVARQRFTGPALCRELSEAYDILFIHQGEVCCEAGGKSHALSEGEALMIGRIPRYTVKGRVGVTVELQLMTLYGEMCESYYDLIVSKGAELIPTGGSGALLPIMDQLAEQMRISYRVDPALSVSGIVQLLTAFYRCSLDANGYDAGSGQPRWFVTVSQFIEANYARRLTVEEMASACGVSAPHFYRLFREYTGLSPYRYLTRLRIGKAKGLLEHTDFPVRYIAHRVGCGAPGHFIAYFKEETGCTPDTYRRLFR